MTVSTHVDRLDLAAFLRPGDRIVWGQACGEPTTLVEALIAQAESIGRLSAFAATSFSGLLSAGAAARFSLSSMGAIGALRTVAAAGRLGIVPCHIGRSVDWSQGLMGMRFSADRYMGRAVDDYSEIFFNKRSGA